MAWLGLTVPLAVGKLFESAEVPGEKEKASDLHVTVLHLGDVPMETVAQCLLASAPLTVVQRPFLCVCDRVDSFPSNPEYGIPVVSPVTSPALHTFHESLKSAFDVAGIPYSKKYPEYKPHVTLARNKGEGAKPFSAPLKGYCAWVATELVIWGGENGKTAEIRLPFVLGPGFLLTAAARIASVRRP